MKILKTKFKLIIYVVFNSFSSSCSFHIVVNGEERSIDGKLLVDLMFQEDNKSAATDFGKYIMTQKSFYSKRTVERETGSEELHGKRLPKLWLPPESLNLISRIDGRISYVNVNGNIHFQLEKGLKIE